MKVKKQTKQGISLIVLVITIIVMIILAAAVILSLSSNGIIDRANEAVEKTDESQVKVLAQTIWAEAYLKYRLGDISKEGIYYEVIKGLTENKINTEEYLINVTEHGVDIENVFESKLNHSGTIPAGVFYYSGIDTNEVGKYYGADLDDYKIYYGDDDENVIEGCNLDFGRLYYLNYYGAVFYSDGSAVTYDFIAGQTTSIKNITYEGNKIIQDGQVMGEVSTDGTQIEISEDNFITIADNKFPSTVKAGDVYVYGDYEYRYGYTWYLNWMDNATAIETVFNAGGHRPDISEGWSVRVIDDTKKTYGDILAIINNKPVTNLTSTFDTCELLEIAPSIPTTIVDMTWSFYGCKSLNDISQLYIPNTVTDMCGTFADCEKLTVAPHLSNNVKELITTFSGCVLLETYINNMDEKKDFSNFVIPNSVINMAYAFEGCLLLESAPIIPEKVDNVKKTFSGCTALSGSIIINSTPTIYSYCLSGTKISEVLGSCTIKDEILATK